MNGPSSSSEESSDSEPPKTSRSRSCGYMGGCDEIWIDGIAGLTYHDVSKEDEGCIVCPCGGPSRIVPNGVRE